MRFDIITIFPDMFRSVFSGGVINKAEEKGLIEVNIHNLRDYTTDKHRQVDDRPFGGSAGMVLKPEPIFTAVEKIKSEEETSVFLLSPQGKKFSAQMARKFASFSQMILICGRYEGVDERVLQNLVSDEISIGDYVLTGGELASMVLVDAVARFVPGVVGKMESVEQDSFFEGLFDYPQYTRPRDYKGMKVPEVLFSGDHDKIKRWRREKRLQKTWEHRPDLLNELDLSPEDKAMLKEIRTEKKGK
jgi:tRNA (guanine37-N1)-methyltransferase